jgi:hypothetical protein
VTNNPVGVVYKATLPETAFFPGAYMDGGNIEGEVTAEANPDGKGVLFTVKLSNLPRSGGPFRKLYIPIAFYTDRSGGKIVLTRLLQPTTSTSTLSPTTATARRRSPTWTPTSAARPLPATRTPRRHAKSAT